MKQIKNVAIALLSVASFSCFADWNLQPEQSQLNLVSVKNAAIAEVHHFTKLGGHIDAKGQVSVAIDLASIETQIPIRNERIQSMLFDTAKFATANISATVDAAMLKALEPGQQVRLSLPCKVQLHGKEKAMEVAVSVIALAGGEFAVSSLKPVVLSLADFELVAGVQALQEIAKLNSIAVQVPVTFNLVFAQGK